MQQPPVLMVYKVLFPIPVCGQHIFRCRVWMDSHDSGSRHYPELFSPTLDTGCDRVHRQGRMPARNTRGNENSTYDGCVPVGFNHCTVSWVFAKHCFCSSALKSEAPHRFRHGTRIRVVPLLSRRVVFKRPMRIPRSLLRVERPLKLWVSQYYIDFHTLFRGHECPRCHEEECRICREGFEMDQWVRVLSPCTHLFHAACI